MIPILPIPTTAKPVRREAEALSRGAGAVTGPVTGAVFGTAAAGAAWVAAGADGAGLAADWPLDGVGVCAGAGDGAGGAAGEGFGAGAG